MMTSMKNTIKFFIIIIALVATTPIVIYLSIFNNGLSHNSQDWGAFGSYLSGIYSPIFSFISVLVLLKTLDEMRNTSRQEKEHFTLQLERAQSEKQLDDVISLTKMLNSIIDSNPKINQKNTLPVKFAESLKIKCDANHVSEPEELWDQAYNVMREESTIFNSEMYVFAELLRRVNAIKDEESQYTAKVIVIGLIPNSYRFWLECYARVWTSEGRIEVRKWHDFSDIPVEAEGFLPDPDNSREVLY